MFRKGLVLLMAALLTLSAGVAAAAGIEVPEVGILRSRGRAAKCC